MIINDRMALSLSECSILKNKSNELFCVHNTSAWLHTQTHPVSYVTPLICISPGPILDSVVCEVSPATALELGTYCGYSSVRIARLLPVGTKLITLEFNPDNACIARQVIQYAGLEDKVRRGQWCRIKSTYLLPLEWSHFWSSLIHSTFLKVDWLLSTWFQVVFFRIS